MLEAFQLIVPVFAIVALGYGLGRTPLFPPPVAKGLSDFVWYLAIPILIFRLMAKNSLPGADEILLALTYYAAVLAAYAFSASVACGLFRIPAAEAYMVSLSGGFANDLMLGIPIIGSAFGQEGLRLMLILIAFHSPVLVTLTTVLVQLDRNKTRGLSKAARQSLSSLIRQPVLIALAGGLAMAWLGWSLPGPVDKMAETLAAAVAPCGLFAIGATLSRFRIAGDLPQASFIAAVKLLLQPCLVFACVSFAGLPALWVATATTMAALPTGVLAFNFAMAHRLAERRVATSFLVSSIASMLTIALWIAWLKT